MGENFHVKDLSHDHQTNMRQFITSQDRMQCFYYVCPV
uniref:Uncharacterized protein n=1 Tax=Manihot esculenta TaxID=3983 RepID=A0A2C9WL17_MANES